MAVHAHSRLWRWTEAGLMALGAGFAAVQFQPAGTYWRTQVFAFLSAALPVLAIHARHGAGATASPASTSPDPLPPGGDK